jgi:hypothetical protein
MGLSTMRSLKQREDHALDSALAELTARLSLEGLGKFNNHIHTHVKSRIVMFDVNHDAH